jgi:DNA-nicking Smr family endonuclease
LPKVKARATPASPPPPEPLIHPPTSRPLDAHGLDSSWDRKLARGVLTPDFTLDLHGHSLDAAWMRLEHGLTLAQAQGARVVLVITGRPRPADAADRGRQRGAIRAKLLDWLAAGSHGSRIAAVRGAHPRHGGAGAVYVVLRKGK